MVDAIVKADILTLHYLAFYIQVTTLNATGGILIG
jgi:hypothetical protein